MCKKNKILVILSTILIALFVGLTLLVKFVAVSASGPNGSIIGRAGFNLSIFNTLGQSETWDKVSDICLIFAIVLVGIIAIIGIIQLIKRKSIKKVDKEIICFGIMLIMIAVAYILFELITINYRPVLVDGELEASYPSTHTLIVLCITLSAMLISKNYISNKALYIMFNIFCIVLTIVCIIARLLSGMHWATDIIAGVILSSLIVIIFKTLTCYTSKRS